MTEMAERVALVFAQHGDHFFDNDGPSSASWDDFSPREQLVATAAARAAIEAIEQSDEVVAKLIKEIAGYTGETVTKAEAIEILRSSLKGEGE